MAGGSSSDRELDQTPTWAVLAVCFTIILISLLLEKLLHWFKHVFTEKKKVAMVEALEKVKAELMVLGFISLLLTFTQYYIIKICIPVSVANTMLPCALKEDNSKEDEGKHRRLLWEEMLLDMGSSRRFLAAAKDAKCTDGKVPIISVNGLHQLHIFIFFLAVFHVASSGIMMGLGRLKIRGWKYWENETLSPDYEFSSDPSRFHYVQDNSFVRQHTSFWSRNTFLLYVTSFFRQFLRSVRKEDYLMLRHGFISTHLAPGRKFDFQKYIKRSLEDDFKVVVGISPILWASAGIVLLLNLDGWYTMFWVSILPLVILLAVGTKLQAIITKMAIEISQRNVMVQGVPLVSLGDHLFWFNRPQLILFMIHFTLFQNAFQLVYFLWIWYSFGLNSCFHEKVGHLLVRMIIGVFVQLLCSYVTLPLYALVSQLGSSMKKTVFDEHTAHALKKWHQNAKKHHHDKSASHTPPRSPFRSPVRSPRSSPDPPLHRYRTIGHSADLHDDKPEISAHMRSNSSLIRRGDLEMASIDPNQGSSQIHSEEEGRDDFSFARAVKKTSRKDLIE